MPKTLVVGYDEEGKVDASEAACRVFVEEVVEWEKPQMDQAVRDVCEVRKRHADAYAALQKAYQDFRAELVEATRFDGPAAAKHAGQMIKSCIEHKWAISTGGHNIGIDMVPNTIDADCLTIGRDLLVKETAYLKGE
ncbi:hypothetical protein [uncultured Hyphomicrobium sp.]|uniref:hypothetical protein n=1 Tax=uncultured Hyphomicrobium sp. TaxID=194373 RepID=UPI0025E06E24|nr:hypothetical protein [uncultured Hyphomicrobium sp.]